MIEFLLALVLYVVGVLVNGAVLVKLWSWFVVTTFKLPVLGVAPAIGLAIVASFLTSQHIPGQKTKDILIHNIGCALIALVMGWVVHAFM